MQTTKQAARGKWDGIIAHLIGEEAIKRKHGPCPMCGGRDRYRYDNNRNDGDWFCSHCGVGDGFKLLQEVLGIDFAEAASRVDKIVNNIEEQPFRENIDIDKRRQSLNDTWKFSRNPGIVTEYLKSRHIPTEIIQLAHDLRGHAQLRHYDNEKNMTYRPAMVALIRNPKGQAVSIHRTYLGIQPKEKKIMPPIETINGGCVRLGEPDDTLVIAEGIETALAAWSITGHPAWATISAHGMEELKSIPRHIKRVIVCGDNDKSFTGQAAAFKCAKYMKNRLNVQTEVVLPTELGHDMADVREYHEPRHKLQRWTP